MTPEVAPALAKKMYFSATKTSFELMICTENITEHTYLLSARAEFVLRRSAISGLSFLMWTILISSEIAEPPIFAYKVSVVYVVGVKENKTHEYVSSRKQLSN